MPQHQNFFAKLIVARGAVITISASEVVMQTDSISDFYVCHLRPDLFNQTCNFMPQGKRNGTDGRNSAAIMSVRVTNACGFDFYQNIPLTDFRDGNILHFQRLFWDNKANRFHEFSCKSPQRLYR